MKVLRFKDVLQETARRMEEEPVLRVHASYKRRSTHYVMVIDVRVESPPEAPVLRAHYEYHVRRPQKGSRNARPYDTES